MTGRGALKSHYQLIVIGAGPAGAYAAWTAASAGIDVLLVDRKKEIGYPLACAEAVSREGLENFIEPETEFISSEISCLTMTVATGYSFAYQAKDCVGYVLDRPIFEKYLVERAIKCGATLMMNTYAKGVDLNDPEAVVVAMDTGEDEISVSSDYVIAADGVESMIGRMAGIDTSLELGQCESSLQYRVSGIELNPQNLEFCVGRRYARDGYLWVFSKSEHSANIGLGFNPAANEVAELRECLDGFLRERYSVYNIEFESCGMVPKFMGLKILGRGRLLLAGDAARAIDSLTGAGICRALHTGQLAARAIIQARNRSIDTHEIVGYYTKAVDREIGRDLRFFKMAHRIFRKFDDEDWESLAVFLKEFLDKQETGSIDPAILIKSALTGAPRLVRLARHLF